MESRREARTLLLEKLEEKPELQTEIATEAPVTPEPAVTPEKQTELNLKELKKESLYSSTVIETPNYDFIEASPLPEKKVKEETKTNPKFKLRLLVVTYSIIIAICSIWIISNAVNINNLNNSINETNSAYYVNEAKYILKIKALENAEPSEDGNINPIAPENIFGVQAEAIEVPSDPTPSQNWFDTFCTWISKLFGG